jgi:VWFA-related protein
MHPKLYLSLVALFCVPGLVAQSPAPTGGPASDASTIRINSRIVYVDVIVRDSQGRVVHGLTQKDFIVKEDGVAQPVSYFEEHVYSNIGEADLEKAASAPRSGPTTFSNAPPPGAASGSVNIILFDLLNTPPLDQLAARQDLLRFLTQLPAGQQVALFVLTDHLRMLQDFTSSSDRLIAAAKALDPKNLALIQSKGEMAHDNDFLIQFAKAIGRDPGGTIGKLRQQNETTNSFNQSIRSMATLEALDEIARATSGYSGRKNLLWLAESFPVTFTGQVGTLRGGNVVQPDDARLTADLLANSQIAVYPISLLGLQTEGAMAEVSELKAVSTRDQFNERSALRAGMSDLAIDTGGEAFTGTNDFARAMQVSIHDGSNYYTLAYRPTNSDWNGRFRKIHVDVVPKGYSLSYRRGYYALETVGTPDGPGPLTVQHLNKALQPQTPESTMLLLKSQVGLPDESHPAVKVASSVDPANLALITTADGHRRGQLLVMLVAFRDEAGASIPEEAKAPPQTSAVLNLDFPPALYQDVLSKGIGFSQQLKLAPGHYRLRLGVTDLQSHRIGTLDMPIQVADVSQKGQ